MSNKICEKHKRREIKYMCLDTDCSESTYNCVICLKNDHKDCKSSLIINIKKKKTQINL